MGRRALLMSRAADRFRSLTCRPRRIVAAPIGLLEGETAPSKKDTGGVGRLGWFPVDVGDNRADSRAIGRDIH